MAVPIHCGCWSGEDNPTHPFCDISPDPSHMWLFRLQPSTNCKEMHHVCCMNWVREVTLAWWCAGASSSWLQHIHLDWGQRLRCM